MIDSRVNNEADWLGMSGGHPWHLDNETDSILFLTNMTNQVGGVGFAMQADGVDYYLTRLRLAGHETRAIDLRKLRDAQKPDFRKHTLPADATDGSVHWIRFDGPVTGRLVVLQRHRGMASNYTCSGGCICQPNFQSLHVYPSSWDMLPGETKLFTAQEWRIDCNSFYFYLDLTGGPWASGNPSLATVTPGGGLVTAGDTGGSTSIIMGPINTNIYIPIFHYPVWQCQTQLIHPQCGGTVNVKPKITSIAPTRGLIGVTTSVTVNGAGFGGNPTVNAGTGITVTRGSFSDTQIQASFAVANNAPAGNHAVTVTTVQGTSNSVNLYVQVPTRLSAPPPTLHSYVNQIATHCDGSPLETDPNTPRWGTQDCFLYTLLDQDTPTANTITYTNLTASEAFQWKSGYTQLPEAITGIEITNGQFGDEIAVFAQGGPIPPSFQQTFLQTFTTRNEGNFQTWTVRKNCVRWSGSSVTVTDVTANPATCQ